MKGSSERLSFWGHAEKKVLSVIALSAIGASALAGCGSSEKAPENRAQSAQTAATAETASSATPTANPSIEAPADKKLHSLSDLALLTKQRRYHRSQHLQPNRLSSSRQKRLGLVRRSCLQKIMRPFVHKSMKR